MVDQAGNNIHEILKIIAISVSICTPIIGGIWAILRQRRNEMEKYMLKAEAEKKFQDIEDKIVGVKVENNALYNATVQHFDCRFNDLKGYIKSLKQ